MAGGRPSKYDPKFVEQAEKLCALGATDQELADFFDVSISTLFNWRAEYPEFLEAVKTAKGVADERVERRLYERAMGYEHESVKIFMPAGAEDPVYAPYREKIAPETTAMIFWLKNRQPERWRDIKAQEISGPGGKPIEMVSLTDAVAARNARLGHEGDEE